MQGKAKKHKPGIESNPAPTRFAVLWSVILVAVTFAVFSPAFENGFINLWDDNDYVVNNPDVKGLTLHNVSKVFTSSYVSNYQPITMLAYMAEYSVFGLDPSAFHGASILLHCVNAVLVLILVAGLSGRLPVGVIAGFLFAVHPLRVESVAWVAEQKDVLSSLFYLLSLLLYLQYSRRGGRKFYYGSVLALLLSLLSKPMAISQPLVLLLIDYLNGKKLTLKGMKEKIPFFVLACAFAAIAFFIQKSSGAIQDAHLCPVPLLQRAAVPFYNIVFYLVKTIAPIRLSAFYPYPLNTTPLFAVEMAVPVLIVVLCGLAIVRTRQKTRKVVFGSLFYLAAILPVSQIVHIGNAIAADRYAYLPIIGIDMLIAEAVYLGAVRSKKSMGIIVMTCCSAVLLLFGYLTHERCKLWKDPITLWNDALTKFQTEVAYNNRGSAYSDCGAFSLAIQDYNRAIACNPRYFYAYYNRGHAYNLLGDLNRAIEDYTKVVALTPSYVPAFSDRGAAWCMRGDYRGGIADFDKAIQLDPHYAPAFLNRGMALYSLGDFSHALDDYNRVIALNPFGYPGVYLNRGTVHERLGDMRAAIQDYQKACEMHVDKACQLLGKG